MTTTAAINSLDPQTARPQVSVSDWLWISLIGVLFVLLFRTFLFRMALIATSRWGGDWSHAVVIPLISGYYIYQHRQRLSQLPRQVSWVGLGILVLGIFNYAWWIYPGRNDMLQGYSMIVALFGLILFLYGAARMRILWFAVLYLGFAVKVSDRIWEQLAWQLQLLAARSAAGALNFLGAFMKLDASVTGSTIKLTFFKQGQWVQEAINVAEACSGLRMLAAFVALGVAVAFLVDRVWWQRVTLVVLTVPIAVGVNVGRVTALGLLHLIDKKWAAGDIHTFVGMLMLIPALLGFLLVGWILDRLILHDDDASDIDQKTEDDCHDAISPHNNICRAGAEVCEPPSLSFSVGSTREATREAVPGMIPGEVSEVRPGRMALGVLGGVVLATLIGGSYSLFLACFKPHLLGVTFSRWVLEVLWGISILLVGFVVWLLRRSFRRSGSFSVTQAVCAGVLMTAVVGLQVVVASTRAVLIKKPIELRNSLVVLPQKFGSWQMIDDQRLSHAVLEELRTRQYISRTYRDTAMPITAPGSTIRLHIAYYTGTPDTVPHVPERCFVAAGLTSLGKRQTTLHMRGARYRACGGGQWLAPSQIQGGPVRIPQRQIPVTEFTFGVPAHPQMQSNVIYFFIANGKFLSSPDYVRLGGFSLTDEYSFYCKVEMGINLVADPEVARKRAEVFLSEILPEIMACLPDWSDVTQGRWPRRGIGVPGNILSDP